MADVCAMSKKYNPYSTFPAEISSDPDASSGALGAIGNVLNTNPLAGNQSIGDLKFKTCGFVNTVGSITYTEIEDFTISGVEGIEVTLEIPNFLITEETVGMNY